MDNPIANPADLADAKAIGRWAECYRRLREGGLSADDFQAPIDDPDFRACLIGFWKHRGDNVVVPIPNLLVSDEEARVITVLGERKVITTAQAVVAWPGASIPANVPIRYSEETLQECARENQGGGTDWRLVYIHGLSLREQRKQIGVNRDHQPCFYNSDWWLQEKEDGWANFKPESGYYLVDFNGRFGLTSWKKQDKKIAELGDQFERTHETVVAEAVLSIFKTTQERLLENRYHWGVSLDSVGLRVLVGLFDRRGLVVSRYHPDWDDCGHLRVCLFRKFNT
ncbi:MAG: hypothetical protein HYV54_00690 [Parcubacteria group bacterium]|nr:hypothetical protein [Parcubacteria group bacterium]